MTLALLTESYVRRRRWEADLLAVRIVDTLGQALGGKRETPAADVLKQMGIDLE